MWPEKILSIIAFSLFAWFFAVLVKMKEEIENISYAGVMPVRVLHVIIVCIN